MLRPRPPNGWHYMRSDAQRSVSRPDRRFREICTMTTVNANIAAPRVLQVGGGSVRQIAEILGKFGLSRPLVVTDPFMVSSRHVNQCIDPLAAAGIAVTVFSDTVPDPTDTVIEAGVAELKRGSFDCLIGFGGGS